MTDLSNANDNNDADSVTPEDAEQASEFDLRSLGIDPMNTPLSDLLKIYREQAEICQDYARKQKDGTTDPSSVEGAIKSDVTKYLKGEAPEDIKQTVSDWRTLGTNLTEKVFHYLTSDPRNANLVTSAVLLDELRNCVSLMEDEYNYHYQAAVQAVKDAKGIKSTPSETAIRAKLACIKLKGTKPGEGLINARINMARAMGEEDSIPSDLYKTGGERNVFNTDVFPRLPRLDVEGTISTNSTHLIFRFAKHGETEQAIAIDCTETTLNDVAHNVVSSGAYRVTGKQIEKDLKKAGHGIGATETEWKLEYKTGTLYGKKV
jgi:hypothetical protein